MFFQNDMSVVAPIRNSAYEVTNPSAPVSDFNSGSSDEYRDKFENLKILVSEQQKQIKSQRAQVFKNCMIPYIHYIHNCLFNIFNF